MKRASALCAAALVLVGMPGCYDFTAIQIGLLGVDAGAGDLAQSERSDLATRSDAGTGDAALVSDLMWVADLSPLVDLAAVDAAPLPDLAEPIDLAMRAESSDLAEPHDFALRDLSMADLVVPDLATPDFALPDLATPDLALPDLALPDLSKPDLSNPDLAHALALSFAAVVSYPVGTGPEVIAVGDFNRDGALDLAAGNTLSSGINLLIGKGDGTFSAGKSYATGKEPWAVVPTDLDGDGKIDLVTADYSSSTGTVWMGNGDATFTAGKTLTLATNPSYMVSADYNGDGRRDLVVSTLAGGLYSYLGNGDGTFQAAKVFGTNAGDALTILEITADLTGDGKLDIGFADKANNALRLFPGVGDGTFAAATTLTGIAAPESLVALDLNGDGRLDLAAPSSSGDLVAIFLATGGGAFAAPTTTALPAASDAIGITGADLDNDGHADLVTACRANNELAIQHGNGDGTFRASLIVAVSAMPAFAITGDFNGDGKLDIAVASQDGNVVDVLINTSR